MACPFTVVKKCEVDSEAISVIRERRSALSVRHVYYWSNRSKPRAENSAAHSESSMGTNVWYTAQVIQFPTNQSDLYQDMT